MLKKFSKNSNINFSKKILLEKHRRNQVYQSLDYFISRITYFDFFSKEAFEISRKAKYLTQIFQKKNVTTDIFLLAYISFETETSNLLKEFNITKHRIGKLISKKNIALNFEKRLTSFPFITIKDSFKKPFKQKRIKTFYSFEINKLFEKAAENALIRFKTPVVTPPILLLTILEDTDLLANKVVRKLIKNDTDLFLLRYKIFKQLHKQESTIRALITTNQQYFAYLLKTELTDLQFRTLIKKESLGQSVSLFRNEVISQVLNIDTLNLIEEEIKISKNINRPYLE